MTAKQNKSVKENLASKKRRQKGPQDPLLEAAISFEAGLIARRICEEQQKKEKQKWDDEKLDKELKAHVKQIRPHLAGSAYDDKGLAQYLIGNYTSYKLDERRRLGKER